MIYRTIKTSLKSILKDEKLIQPQINNLVIECNQIIIQGYQFLRLYILYHYENNLNLPEVNEKLISYIIKVQGIRDNRGKKSKDIKLLEELNKFYKEEFQPLIKKENYSLKNLTYLIPYLIKQIITSYENNIKEHYFQHFKRFINKTTNNKELSKEIKKIIFGKKREDRSQEALEWLKTHLRNIIPKEIKKSLSYDLKVEPNKYLPSLLYMNSILEKEEIKLFQPLPLRNDIVPKNITLDTASLIMLFAKKGQKGKLLKDLILTKGLIWREIFKMDKKVFKNKHYKFDYLIETNGISVSLLFFKEGERKEKKEFNLEDLSEEEKESFKKRNIVGVDPGKRFLVYMVDDEENKLKYSSCQRRFESTARGNKKILEKEKVKNEINEKEVNLSKLNSKTVDYKKFKKFIEEKTKLDNEVKDFYQKELWRKMKWRQFVYLRSSEDRFLNRIESSFGSDCILAYGNWSRSSQMKHFISTKNKGIKKLIEKRFTTITVDEYNTSKKCCGCHNYLKSKEFRLLTCSNCVSSENKNIVFRTRDVNSSINIRNIFRFYLTNGKRPDAFLRSSPSQNEGLS